MRVVYQAIIRSELQTLLGAKTTQQKGLPQKDEVKTAQQKLYVSSQKLFIYGSVFFSHIFY